MALAPAFLFVFVPLLFSPRLTFSLFFSLCVCVCVFYFLQKEGSDGSLKTGNLEELQEQIKRLKKELQQAQEE